MSIFNGSNSGSKGNSNSNDMHAVTWLEVGLGALSWWNHEFLRIETSPDMEVFWVQDHFTMKHSSKLFQIAACQSCKLQILCAKESYIWMFSGIKNTVPMGSPLLQLASLNLFRRGFILLYEMLVRVLRPVCNCCSEVKITLRLVDMSLTSDKSSAA